MTLLPGWSDLDIMETDLARLCIAIEAASEQRNEDWKLRARLAGCEVNEPDLDPETDEAFNDQVRAALAGMRHKVLPQ